MFKITQTNKKYGWWSIIHNPSGLYLDHDGILREDDPQYAGIWSSEQAATRFLTDSPKTRRYFDAEGNENPNWNKKGINLWLSKLGRTGGNATKAKHDSNYYSRIGKLGAQKRWSKK